MEPMRVEENNGSNGSNFETNHLLYNLPNESSSESHMIDIVRKIRLDSASTNMASCNYSLKEQSSLHSEIYSIRIEDIHQVKNQNQENEPASLEQSSFFKYHLKKCENTDEEPCSFVENEEKESCKENSGLSHDNDIPQKLDAFEDTQKEEINEMDVAKNGRKSYMSSLHEIVDRNHLESPSRKILMQNEDLTEFENFKLEHEEIEINKKNTESLHEKEENQENQEENIKSVVIEEKSEISKKESSNESNNNSPKQKSKHNRVEIRKIPSNLYVEYDELMLSVNKNEKPLKKGPLDSPIKLKEKSNSHKSSKDSKENDESKTHDNSKERKTKKNKKEEELLVNLRVVEGFCKIERENDKLIETKFVINKNEILFQNERKIMINKITKIKLISKDENHLMIKICYEVADNKKPETMIVELLHSDEKYFSHSYQLYSEIILRKLLLMKISINEVNEKIEAGTYIKSPENSPMRSPMSLPQSVKDIEVERNEVETFEAELFKKGGVIFNSWEKKYFTLSSNSFLSFSSPPINGERSKPHSTLHKTSEIWTRFELIYGYLVIKLWQNKIEKIQIGIPLCDFTNCEGPNNWLYGLSKHILWGQQEN